MKLRNKKTGEIVDYNPTLERWNGPSKETKHYVSLAELNDEWEDYEELKSYYIGRCGTIEEFDPTKDVALTEMLKEIGNYFETKEETEKAVEKLKAWKRLKDKGLRILDWSPYRINNPNRDDYVECVFKIVFDIEKYESKCDKDLDLLFSQEGD